MSDGEERERMRDIVRTDAECWGLVATDAEDYAALQARIADLERELAARMRQEALMVPLDELTVRLYDAALERAEAAEARLNDPSLSSVIRDKLAAESRLAEATALLDEIRDKVRVHTEKASHCHGAEYHFANAVGFCAVQGIVFRTPAPAAPERVQVVECWHNGEHSILSVEPAPAAESEPEPEAYVGGVVRDVRHPADVVRIAELERELSEVKARLEIGNQEDAEWHAKVTGLERELAAAREEGVRLLKGRVSECEALRAAIDAAVLELEQGFADKVVHVGAIVSRLRAAQKAAT